MMMAGHDATTLLPSAAAPTDRRAYPTTAQGLLFGQDYGT